LRHKLNETNFKAVEQMRKSLQDLNEGVDLNDASMIAQMGSLKKTELFANEILKRATNALLTGENTEDI
jgi:hypothetical protein